MNEIDRVEAHVVEYRPVLRPRITEVRVDSQRSECACPDLCLIDHDN